MSGTWAISKGLNALYNKSNKTQETKEELNTLKILSEEQKQDRLEKEQAQIKEQAYYDQISKFADNLLQNDRDKINQKTKLLAKNVREHMKYYGGSAQKFFANGGHKILNEYKRGVINSEEASIYLQNKKNMTFILDAQQRGKGHLLNQKDLENLKNYKNQKGNAITYSGLLNEIELPNANNYDYGSEVPAEDILKNKSNYMKIYGNWTMANPNSGEPDMNDLIVYTKKHYGLKGSNTAKQVQQQRERLAKIKALSKAKSSSKGGSGRGSSKRKKEDPVLLTGQVSSLLSYMPKKASDFYNRDLYKNFNYKNQLNTLAKEDFNSFANDKSLKHKSTFDTGHQGEDIPLIGGLVKKANNLFGDWFNEELAPTNARTFFKGTEPLIAKSVLSLDDENLDQANRIVKTITPNGDWFDAGGRKLNTLDDELDYDSYKGDYKIGGVINIGVVKTDNNGNNKYNMLMDIYDGNDIDDKKTKAYNEGFLRYDKEGKVSQDANIDNQMAIVLEREDGTRFYAPFNPSDPNIATKINEELKGYNDIQPVVKDAKKRTSDEENISKYTKDQEVLYSNFWNVVEENNDLIKPMYSELTSFSKNGNYDGRRDNLIKSFYGAMATLAAGGQDISNKNAKSFIGNIFSDTHFTDSIMEAMSEQDEDYETMIKNYSNSDKEIVLKMLEKDPDESQKSFYQAWLQNLEYLNK